MPPNTYLDTVQAKRTTNLDDKHHKELLAALEAVKRAAGSTPAPVTIESDNTDVITALNKLETAFKSATYPDMSPELQAIKQAIEEAAEKTGQEPQEPVDFSGVIAAIQAIELQPAEIDFTPLQDTIKEHFPVPEVEDKRLELSCYRAQDIIEDGDKQYVGFLNAQGDWYIIENDIKGNSMRYVFGTKNYAKAFKKAATYQYKLLNEAIDASDA